MKKFTTMAYVAALALVSTAGLSSCKSDNEPGADYSGEVVKTEFAINLPDEAVGDNGGVINKMPSSTVQIGGRSEFQGMTSLTLVPFAKTTDIVSGDTRLGDNITLTDIASAEDLGTNSNAKVYPSIAIPLTTATFLFYAKSKATGSSLFQTGELDAVNLDNTHQPADYEFRLKSITATKGSPTGSGSAGESLIAYLNSIASATDGTKAWKNYVPADDVAMAAMFTTFKSWNSLSSYAVARGLSDLYASLASFSTTLATNIKSAIDNPTYATVAANVVTLKSGLDNFPASFDLPDGAVRIKWNDSSKEFEPCAPADYTTDGKAELDSYVYPAELWYFANSQIKTSNSSKQAMYDNVNDWATVLAAHTDAVAVNTLTRAVAIEDVIQYGVARLDVIVKLSATTLNDNTPVTPQTISCSSYPVTGVLIGGQKNVGFNFEPKGALEYTIYDNVMTGGSISATTTNANANSTLVLQSETGNTKDVQIAIELQNASGKDFIGAGGQVIPNGSKFYLVAKLTAAAANVTANTVFKQDYTTTATLTIGSLASAYHTIPDLRTPQLELGMSVDLTWTAGNTYAITIP
jgi:hypothetical protein